MVTSVLGCLPSSIVGMAVDRVLHVCRDHCAMVFLSVEGVVAGSDRRGRDLGARQDTVLFLAGRARSVTGGAHAGGVSRNELVRAQTRSASRERVDRVGPL